MKNLEKDNILHVRMFGSFSMVWNGEYLAGGTRSSETQFAYLMQLLLHNRRSGISREQLSKNLFADRDIKDFRKGLADSAFAGAQKGAEAFVTAMDILSIVSGFKGMMGPKPPTAALAGGGRGNYSSAGNIRG